jgi:hypothetical protein
MDISIGQVYSTGNLRFTIVSMCEVTRHFTNLQISFLDSGRFSNWTIDCGSDELVDGIESGEIQLVSG